MARLRSVTGRNVRPLEQGWQMALSDDGRMPEKSADWIDAPVPGTAAQALMQAGRATPELLATFQSRHIWYRAVLEAAYRPATLRFDGLAPHADIYIDGALAGVAKTMFDSVEIELRLDKPLPVWLHFKPLAESLNPATRRQKWRPHLIASPHMRNARATLLGHMPGWCAEVQPVGPYRDIALITNGEVAITAASVRAVLDEAGARVTIALDIDGDPGPLVAQCWNSHAELLRGEDGRWRAEVAVDKPPLWWPHTHGAPHLVPVAVYGEDIEIDLGQVGFRSIACDSGNDGAGFGLIVNGVPVFCRGVNWSNADLLRLPGGADDYEPHLRRMRDAGINMVRIGGTMTRETPAFFDLCDRYGILVWMDEPNANFDYDFAHLQREFDIDGSLSRALAEIETSPSLAVVCGGSEMAQQGAMLSLPESIWTSAWCTERLPEIVASVRPDVISVPNSPWGGELPFQVDQGVSHYYGVGAYMLPLNDARRANVRFATECLAFANLPQPERLAAIAGDARPGTPAWDALVVRDLKADWNFEDVRDHYLGLLYGNDPARLKADDPARYLALSTVVPGEVMEATFAEWRREGSVTRGGLVWLWQDLKQGFGWGVLDVHGVPKPAYYALQRAFAPLSLTMTDEGVNGLHLHIINEGSSTAEADFDLTLTCYDENGAVVVDGARQINVPPRGQMKITSAAMFGIFFDVNTVYRFGPPAHVVTVARLTSPATGETRQAFHFPQGRSRAMAAPELAVAAEQHASGLWQLELSARRIAQGVHLVLENGRAETDWFHLAPGSTTIRTTCTERPRGSLTSLNDATIVRFS